MKRFFYESKLAKVLLAFSSCHTITLGPFVCSKRSAQDIPQHVRNHESCHSIQWIEVACVTGILVLLIQLLFGISPLWYLLAAVAFYIWYGVEWLIKTIIYRSFKTAYKSVSFEQEAYSSEYDCNYIENRPLFTGWIKYINKKSEQ